MSWPRSRPAAGSPSRPRLPRVRPRLRRLQVSCEARALLARPRGAQAAGGGTGSGRAAWGARGRWGRRGREARGWRPGESPWPDVAEAQQAGPPGAAGPALGACRGRVPPRGCEAHLPPGPRPTLLPGAGPSAAFSAVTLGAAQACPATGGRVPAGLLPPGVTLDLGLRASVSAAARRGGASGF